MSNDSAPTLLLRPEILRSLDELAEATRRSRTELVEQALEQYLEVQRWQIEGIREAIDEADSGVPGIPHDRMAKWLDSWGKRSFRYLSQIRSDRCGSSGAAGRSPICWLSRRISPEMIREPRTELPEGSRRQSIGSSAFPQIGRPGRVEGTRELVVARTPYIVPYRVQGDEVQILRVYHAARRWPERL